MIALDNTVRRALEDEWPDGLLESLPQINLPSALQSGAIAALKSKVLDEKIAITLQMAKLWFSHQLSLTAPSGKFALENSVPERPGRPDKPELVHPMKVKKRKLNSKQGQIALLHSLAHIELNAIDLALDVIARFAREPMPRSFYDGWVQVALEEAKHFSLLRHHLQDMGANYGDFPAHDGLWEAAQETHYSLTVRLAVVPLILEARGLDVAPSMTLKLQELGNHRGAEILSIIYRDEQKHVAIAAKWFRFLCAREGKQPAHTFQKLVRKHFRGPLKPPFNDTARAACGLTPLFYRCLTATNRS
jgi:uncharacterized ferritin-like protein (DUF455 family)